MTRERVLSLVGIGAALVCVTVALLAVNLLIQPTGMAHSAGLQPSERPLIGLPDDDGTPEPKPAFDLQPLGSIDGTCVNPQPIACGEQDSRNTSGYNSDHDSYSCPEPSGWEETGPEVIYSFTLAAGTNYSVTAKLSNMTADQDVFILSGCDVDGCFSPDSFGDVAATVTDMAPGSYYIAVDGYLGAAGDYTLSLNCTPKGVVNNPPDQPSNPMPGNGGIGVVLRPELSWQGGDPDIGDTVVYTVSGNLKTAVLDDLWCASQSSLSCKTPYTLKANSAYTWQVLARDQDGAETWSPVWEFTTGDKYKVRLPIVLKAWRPKKPPVPPSSTPSNTPSPTPSSTPSATPTLPTRPGIRFYNQTPYIIISLTINGVEQFPSKPMGILPGYYMEFDLAPGKYQVTAWNGNWNPDGTRFPMYPFAGEITVQPGKMVEDIISGPAIEILLPDYKSSRFWYGDFWEGYPAVLHHASFCFYDNNKFRFYIDGVQDDTGTYAELYRGVGLVTFRATDTGGTEAFDGVLDEIDGSFKMGNGSADWKIITYVPDDTVTCPASP